MPDKQMLVEKLLNMKSFMKDDVLTKMNVTDESLKKNIINGYQKQGIDVSAEDKQTIDEVLKTDNIIEFLLALDVQKLLDDDIVHKKLEMGVLKVISPHFNDDDTRPLKILVLALLHHFDNEYTMPKEHIEKVMLYMEFLHDFFNN